MAVLTNFPDIRPSLLLDFANSRRADPRLSVVRATTGTITNAAGQLEVVPANSPRIDFDPVTGRCLGLLVEEQRSNLLLNSATPATQSVTVTAQAYTLSIYGSGSVAISGAYTGVLNGSGSSINRTSLTFTPSAGSITLTPSGSGSNWQMELGAFPTSYIPTTTAQVTRAADKLTLAGANFSNWFRTDEGTLFADFASYAAGITTSIFTVDSGSQDNRVQMRNSGTANAADQVIVVAASVIVANMSLPGGTHLLGQFKKTALAYKVDDFRLGSGTHAVSDTAGALPVGMNIARIGDGISSTVLTGHIRKIAYYPQRLTNAQLQAITAD